MQTRHKAQVLAKCMTRDQFIDLMDEYMQHDETVHSALGSRPPLKLILRSRLTRVYRIMEKAGEILTRKHGGDIQKAFDEF